MHPPASFMNAVQASTPSGRTAKDAANAFEYGLPGEANWLYRLPSATETICTALRLPVFTGVVKVSALL